MQLVLLFLAKLVEKNKKNTFCSPLSRDKLSLLKCFEAKEQKSGRELEPQIWRQSHGKNSEQSEMVAQLVALN